MTIRSLLLLAALALPYAAPAADAPAPSPVAPPSPPAVSPSAPLTLHDLLVAALNQNLELRAKRLDPQTQLARVEGAKGAFDPVLAAGGSYASTENAQNQRDFLSTGSSARIYDETSARFELGVSGKVESGATYQLSTQVERTDNTFNRTALSPFHPEFKNSASLSLTQPLLKDFGRASNLAEVRLQQGALAVSRHELRTTVMQVLGDVTAAYCELVFAQENTLVKQEAVTLAQNLVRENQRRLDEGKMAPIDVTQAQGRLAEAREELLLARNFTAQRRNTLRTLTRESWDDADATLAVDGTALIRTAQMPDRDALRSQLFARSPGYLAALETVENEKIRVAYAENQRWPRIDLKASLDYNGLSDSATGAYTAFENRTGPNWSAGLVVSIPLPGRTGKSLLAEARNRKLQALLNVKRNEVQMLAAFDTSLRDIDNATERLLLVKDTVVFAQATLDSEEKRLVAGLTTSYNVANAQKDLSQARSRELATLIDLNKAVVQLWFVVGILPEQLKVEIVSN